MSRLFSQRKEAFAPTKDIKNRTWWHGTTEYGADIILREGMKAKGMGFEEGGMMEPQKGRIYFADSIKQAFAYATTRAGQMSSKENNIYIFEVPGSAFNDLTLDEDTIADMVLTYYDMEDSDTRDLNNTAPLNLSNEIRRNKPLAKKVIDILQKRIKDFDFVKLLQSLQHKKNVWYEGLVWYTRMAIEKKYIPDSLSLEIIEKLPSAITSDGVIWPSKLYIIPWVWNDPEHMKSLNPDELMRYWNSVKDRIKVIDVKK